MSGGKKPVLPPIRETKNPRENKDHRRLTTINDMRCDFFNCILDLQRGDFAHAVFVHRNAIQVVYFGDDAVVVADDDVLRVV